MKQEEPNIGTLKALEKIKKAEAHARDLLKEAKEHTSIKVIQDAQEEAKRIIDQLISDARNKAKAIREDVLRKAEHEASRVREETQTDAENLRTNSKRFVPEAVEKVSKEIKSYMQRGLR